MSTSLFLMLDMLCNKEAWLESTPTPHQMWCSRKGNSVRESCTLFRPLSSKINDIMNGGCPIVTGNFYSRVVSHDRHI